MFDDVTSSALRSALAACPLRQRVIADNIANIETPGFRAGKVKFEDALRSAVADGGTPAVVGRRVAKLARADPRRTATTSTSTTRRCPTSTPTCATS